MGIPMRYGRNDHRGGSLTLFLSLYTIPPLLTAAACHAACATACCKGNEAITNMSFHFHHILGRDDSVRALCPVPAHHLPRVPVIGAGRLATGQSCAFGRSPVNASAGSLTPPGGREALAIRSADPAVGM